MLTESQIKDEIKLLDLKIESYLKKLEPFIEIQNRIQKEILDRCINNTSSESLNVTLTIKQKSTLEATIKRWEHEKTIYKRILDGKRMDNLWH